MHKAVLRLRANNLKPEDRSEKVERARKQILRVTNPSPSLTTDRLREKTHAPMQIAIRAGEIASVPPR
jgi:hypothetical protein